MKSIDAQTLHQWMEKNTVSVIDVREPAEYRAQHIKNAQCVPLSQLDKFSLLDIPNSSRLLVMCRSGRRSAQACKALASKFPQLDIYNLEGGIIAWNQCGLPVNTSASRRFVLPVDQQVQFVIGLMVLIGSLLGLLVNPLFTLIPIFFGCGLIFAGLSGFCGLARIMAKMRWNQ